MFKSKLTFNLFNYKLSIKRAFPAILGIAALPSWASCPVTGDSESCTNNSAIVSTVNGATGLDGQSYNNITLTNSASGSIEMSGESSKGIAAGGTNVTIINSGYVWTNNNDSYWNASYGIFTNGDGASITNTGTISNTTIGNGAGIITYANSSSINNSGGVTTTNSDTEALSSWGETGIVNNSGVISTAGNASSGIHIYGINSTVSNTGTISTTGDRAHGITSDTYADNVRITNTGSITTIGFEANGIYSGKDNAVISNQGSIYTTNNNSAGISIHGLDTSVTNTGSIITLGDDAPPNISADGIASFTDRASINNSGTIQTSGPSAHGIRSLGADATIVNTGTIAASGGVLGPNSHGIYNAGSGATISNRGSITSTASNTYGIYNIGSITTLTNAQGGNTPLTYYGNLPTNYNVVLNGANYGKLDVTGASTSQTTFGLDGSSTLAAGTFSSVLNGVGYSNFANASNYNTWYSFSPTFQWELVPQGMLSTASAWDLIVAYISTNMEPGSTFQSSNLGTTVNPVFDGGTLQVSNSGTISQNMTITANNGTIDQNSKTSNFTGVISDAAANAPGKLIIENSGAGGAVTLSGVNTYSGGTEVQAGATLAITGADSLGSGALSLVGSATVPATLQTLANMTINNQISVSGDPTFNVAPGTTTTVANPITDGASAGDVVVDGGGTLNLAAANTYSGPTTINAGSTLALTGAGSITYSNGVTNNGTFNISGASSTVNLVGSYTQNASGNLVMAGAPGAFQKLIIAGPASLGGALTMNAVAGNYKIGYYTLLSANGLSGRFSTFASNFADVTPLGYQLQYGANDVTLYLAPSTTYTQQSIQQNAQGLSTVINQQAAALQAGLSYDCTQYDKHNLCISVGGRYTYAGSGPSGNAESGLVIVGYRPLETLRVGGFADQSVSIASPSGISQSKTSPMWGVFGNWNLNKDRNGLGVQASAAFASSQLSITRAATAYSEPGQGNTQFGGQGYQAQANYAQPVNDKLKVIPYLGLRYTQINNGAYTENSNANMTAPLSFNAMAQNTFAAIGGVGVSSWLAEKLKGTASAGIQQNLNYSMGNYQAASALLGQSFVAQMPSNTNSMATASAGLYYDVRKNERIGLNALWQQQPFINTNTTSVIATYTIGL